MRRTLTGAGRSRSVPPVNGNLRIAIDVRPLALDAVSGIGLVIALIVNELEGRGIRFVGVSDRPPPEGRLPNSVPVAAAGVPGKRIRWEAGDLPRLLHGLKPAPALFHAAWNHGLPPGLPFPSVLTIYDLIPWRFPKEVPWPSPAWLHRALYRRAMRASSRNAALIITGSEVSRGDIATLLPRAFDRVEVIPNPLPRWFRPAGEQDGISMRNRLAGGKPYWLYLGGFEPRKSIPVILQAMSQAFPDPSSAPDLVLAGTVNEYARSCESIARDLGVRARFPGYVADSDLPALFAGASLFLYPSRYEGFGMPLLFAMASGTPAVVSDGGSVPEVLGDAGIVVPAGDVAAWAAVLGRASAEPATLAALGARGLERVRGFSPDAFAERMLRAYERAVTRRAEYA